MSAHMVDRATIAYLIEAALFFSNTDEASWWDRSAGHRHAFKANTAGWVGHMLWEENKRSVQTRYPDTVDSWPSSAPGPVGEDYYYGEHVRPRGLPAPEPWQTLAALRCYEYQACETSNWISTPSFWFCDSLRRSVIAYMMDRNYTDWTWVAPKTWVNAYAQRKAEVQQ